MEKHCILFVGACWVLLTKLDNAASMPEVMRQLMVSLLVVLLWDQAEFLHTQPCF